MANELSIQGVIESIISDAFVRIEYAYQHHREPKDNKNIVIEKNPKTRLVFPSYSSKTGELTGSARISEQELRFAFVEAFNKSEGVKKLNLLYSIETPTRRRYKGFSKGKPDVAKDGKGRSAEFDMVIFDKGLRRVCMIEFKAKSVIPSNYEKDILKLIEDSSFMKGKNEKGVLGYFINLFGSRDSGTIDTMKDKIIKFRNKKKYTNVKDIIIWYYILGETKDKFKFKSLKNIEHL